MKLIPLTIAKAKKLNLGDIVYEKNEHNSDGTNRRWKVTGKVKVWKRDKDRVKVPIKHGLYHHAYITKHNIDYILIERG